MATMLSTTPAIPAGQAIHRRKAFRATTPILDRDSSRNPMLAQRKRQPGCARRRLRRGRARGRAAHRLRRTVFARTPGAIESDPRGSSESAADILTSKFRNARSFGVMPRRLWKTSDSSTEGPCHSGNTTRTRPSRKSSTTSGSGTRAMPTPSRSAVCCGPRSFAMSIGSKATVSVRTRRLTVAFGQGVATTRRSRSSRGSAVCPRRFRG